MSYLPFALLAYFLNSISVTIDKFLLNKYIPDPLIYIFYFSLISLLSLTFIPFVNIPAFDSFFLASISTLFWTAGAYLMFLALKSGAVQRVIPIIGTLTPLFLLVFASLSHSISEPQILAVVILVLGLVFLTLPDWGGRLTKREIILELFASLFFAINYVFLRQAFLGENFLTVFVWSRPILIPLGIIILIVPRLRNKVLKFSPSKIPSLGKTLTFFAVGQTSAGISEFLLIYSISLANPALINSLQGVKYVFLYMFGLILGKRFAIFKETNTFYSQVAKILGIILLVFGLYMLVYA